MATTAVKEKTGSMKAQHIVSRVLIYALLIIPVDAVCIL